MGLWVLIVAFAAAASGAKQSPSENLWESWHVAMQEFGSLGACQHASIEAQKIAPGIRVVCVPKGGPQ